MISPALAGHEARPFGGLYCFYSPTLSAVICANSTFGT
jgi:hypothetical protein